MVTTNQDGFVAPTDTPEPIRPLAQGILATDEWLGQYYDAHLEVEPGEPPVAWSELSADDQQKYADHLVENMTLQLILKEIDQ